MGRKSQWAVTGLALCCAVVIAAFAVMLQGQAHADYDHSMPEAGSTVETAPTIVEIYFSQEIDESGTSIRVLGPDGAPIDLGDTTLDLFDPERKRVTVSIQSGIGPGQYTVEWVSLSGEDGESDSGSFEFTVSGLPAGTPGASPVASPVASPMASPESTPDQE